MEADETIALTTHPPTHEQALGLWGTRLDKGKLRNVINALDQYYAQRGTWVGRACMADWLGWHSFVGLRGE